MEYDLSALCQIRKVSAAEDFELQVRRLDEMGKIIDTPTTMLTKPPQPQGSATEQITLMSEVMFSNTGNSRGLWLLASK